MKKRLVAVLAGLMVLTFGATSAFASISSASSDALVEAGLTNPVEVGTVSGTVSEVGEDEDGTVYTVIELSSDTEDGTYYIIIDGEVYEVVVESGVATIYGYEAAEGDELSDITLYADDEDGSDDTDDTNDTNDANDTGSSSDSDDSDDESDPTGEFSVLPLVAVAALAGVVVCGKKIKFYA